MSRFLISAARALFAVVILSCGERYTGPFRDPNAVVIPSFADSAFGAGGAKWYAGRTFDTITAARIDAQSFYSVEFRAASGATLVALNLANGALRWAKTVPASGDVVSTSGTVAAVSSSVVAFDATTGIAKFTYQPATARLVTSNGAAGGVQIIVGNASGEVVALNASTGLEAWKLQVDTAAVRGVAVSGGTVFAGGNGFLAAVTIASGTQKWKRVTTETPRPFVTAAPAVDSGRVTIATFKTPTSGMANYDVASGTLSWSASGSVPSSGAEAPGQPACDSYIMTNSTSAISALRSANGTAAWGRSLGAFASLSVSCAFSTVMTNALVGSAGSFRNDVQVLRTSDGALLSQYPKTAGQALRIHRVLRNATTLFFLTDKGITAVASP